MCQWCQTNEATTDVTIAMDIPGPGQKYSPAADVEYICEECFTKVWLPLYCKTIF